MSYFNFFRAHDQFMPAHLRFRGGGFFGPPRGGVSITENVTIKNGPSGFWGFMTGLTQGLFGGGMGCGMGMGGSIFGGYPMMGYGMGMPMMGMGSYGYLNGATTTQGNNQQTNPDIDNLNAFFGSKGYIIRMEKDGTYTAAKDGKIVASGSYDDVKTKLSDLADTSDDTTTKKDPEKTEAQLKEEKAKEKGLELKDGKWKDSSGNEYTWDAENRVFNPVKTTDAGSDDGAAVGDGDDGDDATSGADGNQRIRKHRTRGANGAHGAGNRASSAPTKLDVEWDLTPINSLKIKKFGIDNSYGVAYGKGTVIYKGQKFEGTSNIPRSVADAKAVIAAEIEAKIKAAGLDNEITIYDMRTNGGGGRASRTGGGGFSGGGGGSIR